MKKIFYLPAFLLMFSLAANAQSKIMQMKQKNNFMLHMYQGKNLKGSNNNSGSEINPYWQDVDAPHTTLSFIPQIKIPNNNTVWARVNFDSLYYDSKMFLRTADNGKTWRFDSIPSPEGYALGSLSAIDANTCYASMYDGTDGQGGGIYKTTDGGANWKKLGIGQLFPDSSFVDFVYFFNAKNGIAVGDNDGVDTTTLQIYTTCDEGNTWQRVPNKNIPAAESYVFSSNFNGYTVFKNRFWLKAYDAYGNSYIYRSDDYGKHWQKFLYTLTTQIFDFAFTDKQNGLGISFDFGVGPHEVETHDGGKTWADKNFIGYPMGGFITVIPGTHTYVTALPDGLTPVFGSSYSNDYGATWKLIDSGFGANHSAIAYLNPLYGWTGRAESFDAETKGGMYKWKLNFSLDNTVIASNKNASLISKNDSINARLYPNPAKDILRVEGLNASATTTLSLYNISGRLMERVTANGKSYSFNIQKLNAGNYYIRMQSGEKVSTLQFVKQ